MYGPQQPHFQLVQYIAPLALWPPRAPSNADRRVGNDIQPAYYGSETPRHVECAKAVTLTLYIYFDGVIMVNAYKGDASKVKPIERGRVTFIIVNPNNEESYFRYIAMPIQDYLD